MIKVSVFYPNEDGRKFDMDYYVTKHIPMVLKKVGSACKGAFAERGVAGGSTGVPPTYTAMGHLLFDSVEAFQGSFMPHFKEIVADIPNYTQIQPIIQISEVRLG